MPGPVMTLCKNKTSCQYYYKNTKHHEWQGRLWLCVKIKPHASIIIKILDIMNGRAGYDAAV